LQNKHAKLAAFACGTLTTFKSQQKIQIQIHTDRYKDRDMKD